MRTPPRPLQHGPPREGQAMSTIFVSSAPLAGFEEEAKVRTLLRSIGVLAGWLEENRASADQVRVRRIKRWRGEALEQLGLEINRTTIP
jgi:hypothetical protein